MIHLLDGLLPSAYSLADPDDLDEELRLLYVAVTRAERDLFLSYPVLQHRRGAGSTFTRPSRFIDGLPETLLEPLQLVEETAPVPALPAPPPALPPPALPAPRRDYGDAEANLPF